MKVASSLVAFIGLSALLISCGKDVTTPNTVPDVVTVTNLYADTTTGFSPTGRPIGRNEFTYFSLRENKIITGADTLTNKWDIAFKQFYIKVNGGTNATGGGNAAAAVLNTDFALYKKVDLPNTAFAQDNGATWAINPMPGGWYTYSTTTFIALPIPGKTFVIRTADGRYAKMEILSFYKDGVTPATSASPAEKALKQFFYQFRFAFQADGTVDF
jgi:hypothetical protein